MAPSICGSCIWLVRGHRGALRNAVGDQRFFRLPCSRHAGLHIFLGAGVGNVRKITRQLIARHKLPRAVQRWRAIPAPGNQNVILLVGQQLEHIAGSIVGVEQVRAGNGRKLGRSVEGDEFAGSSSPRKRPASETCSTRAPCAWPHPALPAASPPARNPAPASRPRRHRPARWLATVQGPSSEAPGGSRRKVQVIAAGLILQQQHAGVDDAFQAGARHGPPGGRAVNIDQHGRPGGNDDFRRRVVQAFRLRRHRTQVKLPSRRSSDSGGARLGNSWRSTAR